MRPCHAFVVGMLLTLGVSAGPAQAARVKLPPTRLGTVPAHSAMEAAQVEAIVGSLDTDHKIGQLLMVGFGGTDITPQMVHWVRDRHVGGVALFARNIVHAAQVRGLTGRLTALAAFGVAPFLALDQEGGGVVRITDGISAMPGNMTLGAGHSSALAYLAGQVTATDLLALGFSMNLAPVLDVNVNPKNPVIGVRSLGEDPRAVAELGSWLVRGQQEAGLSSVAKHFPGHGDTSTDSHFSLPCVNANMARLDAVELLPFRHAIEAGVDGIMTAHIALPKVAERDMTPATVSPIVLTQILRQHLGFDGMVLTDGLEMEGIAQRYGVGRAAVLAILAGADVPLVLWSEPAREEVYHALKRAVARKEITAERLDASVRRIVTVKVRRGLLARVAQARAYDRNTKPVTGRARGRLARVSERLVKGTTTQLAATSPGINPWHEALMHQVAARGITLVRNRNNLLPLLSGQDGTGQRRRLVVMAPAGPFAARMAEDPHVAVVYLPQVPSRSQRREVAEQAVRLARGADTLVAAVANQYHADMVERVLATGVQAPLALVSLASPYLLQTLPRADAYLCAYSALADAQLAAAEALLGHAKISGTLPVTLPFGLAAGTGLALPALR